MTDDFDFERLIDSYYADDLPAVEVVTDKFRGVARNFLTLPIQLLFDLKAAQLAEDGSDLLLLFDACEMAFNADDFERLKDLNIKDFINVVRAWVYWNKEAP